MGAAFAPDGRHIAILSGRSKQPCASTSAIGAQANQALGPVPLPSEPRSLNYVRTGGALPFIVPAASSCSSIPPLVTW